MINKRYDIENCKQDLKEIIQLCEDTIKGFEEKFPNTTDCRYTIVRDVFLPEMQLFLLYAENNTLRKYRKCRLHSIWHILDSGNYKSLLAEKILTFSGNLRKLK